MKSKDIRVGKTYEIIHGSSLEKGMVIRKSMIPFMWVVVIPHISFVFYAPSWNFIKKLEPKNYDQ